MKYRRENGLQDAPGELFDNRSTRLSGRFTPETPRIIDARGNVRSQSRFYHIAPSNGIAHPTTGYATLADV